VPALALAGAAAGGGAARHGSKGWRRRPARIAGVAALAVVAVTAVPPLMAAWLIDRAQREWRADPQSALADLRRAEDVNPLSARPPLVRGILAIEIGAPREARAAFGEAARRDPSAWYPPLALGMLAAASGQHADAERYVAVAAARNPRAPSIGQIRRQLAAGEELHPLPIQREILAGDD
jgi:tetratricopeptide (TPR) repeat protein